MQFVTHSWLPAKVLRSVRPSSTLSLSWTETKLKELHSAVEAPVHSQYPVAMHLYRQYSVNTFGSIEENLASRHSTVTAMESGRSRFASSCEPVEPIRMDLLQDS